MCEIQFEDIKGVIRCSNGRQYNGQKKKKHNVLQNTTYRKLKFEQHEPHHIMCLCGINTIVKLYRDRQVQPEYMEKTTCILMLA